MTDQYPEVFREEFGTMKGVKADVQVAEGILNQIHWPIHCKDM